MLLINGAFAHPGATVDNRFLDEIPFFEGCIFGVGYSDASPSFARVLRNLIKIDVYRAITQIKMQKQLINELVNAESLVHVIISHWTPFSNTNDECASAKYSWNIQRYRRCAMVGCRYSLKVAHHTENMRPKYALGYLKLNALCGGGGGGDLINTCKWFSMQHIWVACCVEQKTRELHFDHKAINNRIN